MSAGAATSDSSDLVVIGAGLGHLVVHVGATVEVFLTVALNTPTYGYAYHDAAVDGLTRLAELLATT